MRVTLTWPGAPPLDVLAEPGTTVGALRPHLARATGHERWLVDQVTVDGRRVDDSHAMGHPPLTAGADLRLGPGVPDPAGVAVRARWHVAFVDGPSAGELVGVHGACRVGGLRVRVRRERVLVRRRGLWRRWAVGRVIRDRADALELRTRPDAGEPPGPRRHQVAPGRVEWLAPLAGSAALAAVTRQPAFLAAALVVPLVTAAGRAARRLRSPSADARAIDLAAVVARSACGDASSPPIAVEAPWGHDGSLAVLGSRADALAHARSLVVGTVGSHAQVPLVLLTRDRAGWAWSRWARDDRPLPGPDEPGTLVVVDLRPDDADFAAVARWRHAAPSRHRLLLVLEREHDVPAWCTARVAATPGAGMSADRAQAQLRRAVGLASRERDSSVPDEVALGGLPSVPVATPAAVAAAWASGARALRPPIGRAADGPLHLDLTEQGPHVLVGGTTGSGKSELLVTLVLSAALHHPPERLAVLLVDFKGGSGLGPVAGLPHVVDHVTDLDPASARRLLVGLGAELRRRERLLAEAGVRDVRELGRRHAPPRLLVVVDELRALVEDLPEAPAALARLAALGRALGVHLVLATQRPAGAVSADLRANVAMRIALRVNDEADSLDLVQTTAAAAISPATPGRALLRTGDGVVRTLQTARALAARRGGPVRVMPPADGPVWRLPAAVSAVPDDVGRWVAAAKAAATTRPDVPWLPALPPEVRSADLGPAVPGHLHLGLGDDPDQQRRLVVHWEPAQGHLLVVGGPRSGRTTALLTAGAAALQAGSTVHAIGLPGWATTALARVGGALGTVVGPEEPRVVARLVRLLTDAPVAGAVPVVLVDGLAETLDALGAIARGAGADLLTSMVRAGARNAAIAAAGDPRGAVLSLAPSFLDRLVLPLPDPTADPVLGIPGSLAGPRSTPGRGVHLRGTAAVLCQVAVHDAAPGPASETERARAARRSALRPLPRAVDLPVDLPVDLAVDLPGTTPADRAAAHDVPIGVGGDHALELTADLAGPLLVAGPPGSGRTNALAVLAAGHLATGRAVTVVATGGAWPAGVTRLEPAGLPSWSPAGLLVCDDVDELERTDPAAADRLEQLVARASARVAASSAATTVASAYRGPLAALARARRRLVLDLSDPASAELVGPGWAWLTDSWTGPGRGVLVAGRERQPVQVYRFAPADPPFLRPFEPPAAGRAGADLG
ncbi:MAG: FtsK/SpoIIIE domain-containing protein [Brevundimonas sp.]